MVTREDQEHDADPHEWVVGLLAPPRCSLQTRTEKPGTSTLGDDVVTSPPLHEDKLPLQARREGQTMLPAQWNVGLS